MAKYLTVAIPDGIARYLGPMLATGLFGETEDEMVEYLVAHAVRNAVRDGIVEVMLAEVDEAPTGAALFAPGVCSACGDSDLNVSIAKPCPKCGFDGVPF